MNDKITSIIELINDEVPYVLVKKDGEHIQIEISDIYFFEAVDKRVYVYTKEEVYDTTLSLKDIETTFNTNYFIRISKSMVVNIHKVRKIKADVNMRLLAYLINNEAVTITRHYRDDFFNTLENISIIKRGDVNET